MTAILRIVEDGDLKYEVALRGVKRIDGITFYELDLAEIPDIPDPLPLPDGMKAVARLKQPGTDDPASHGPPPGQTDIFHEDTP